MELLPFTEPGNAPAKLAHVPACFISSHGIVVATVRKYGHTSRAQLLAIYRSSRPRPRAVPLKEIGRDAVLYVVTARPGNYEEDILFTAGGSFVSVRSQILAFPSPPATPARRLLALAKRIRAYLG